MKNFNLNKKNIILTGGGGLAKYFAESILEYNGNPILIDNNLDNLKRNKEYVEKNALPDPNIQM